MTTRERVMKCGDSWLKAKENQRLMVVKKRRTMGGGGVDGGITMTT